MEPFPSNRLGSSLFSDTSPDRDKHERADRIPDAHPTSQRHASPFALLKTYLSILAVALLIQRQRLGHSMHPVPEFFAQKRQAFRTIFQLGQHREGLSEIPILPTDQPRKAHNWWEQAKVVLQEPIAAAKATDRQAHPHKNLFFASCSCFMPVFLPSLRSGPRRLGV